MKQLTFPDEIVAPAPATVASSIDKPLTAEDLSPDQRQAYDQILQWYRGGGELGSDKLLTIGGLGGAGKSTLVGVLARQLQEDRQTVAYCAFTGRAASVLGRKLKAAGVVTTSSLRSKPRRGRPAAAVAPGTAFCGTVHSLVYIPMVDEDTEELKGWKKRDELDRGYDLIVVDEASQVSSEMLADLQQHGKPILAVGDHGQLPPVMSSGSVVHDPDIRLEKIHRQAKGNPIIALSRTVRRKPVPNKPENGRLPGRFASDAVVFDRRSNLDQVVRQAFLEIERRPGGSPLDVGILCWTNKARVRCNSVARKILGYSGPPKKGELVICLKNRAPVFNGMRGLLVEDAKEGVEAKARPWIVRAKIAFPEEGLPQTWYDLCGPQFFRENVFKEVEEMRRAGIDTFSIGYAGMLFDFGYALTVHRSQGSAFDHVILYLDRPERPEVEDWRRWAYTAVTRASRKITILI